MGDSVTDWVQRVNSNLPRTPSRERVEPIAKSLRQFGANYELQAILKALDTVDRNTPAELDRMRAIYPSADDITVPIQLAHAIGIISHLSDSNPHHEAYALTSDAGKALTELPQVLQQASQIFDRAAKETETGRLQSGMNEETLRAFQLKSLQAQDTWQRDHAKPVESLYVGIVRQSQGR